LIVRALLKEYQLRRWARFLSVYTWGTGLLGVVFCFVDADPVAVLVLLMLFMNIPAVQYLRARGQATDATYFSIRVYEDQSSPSDKVWIDVCVCIIAIVAGLFVIGKCGHIIYLAF
jgi:hypothetical protein